MIIKKMDSKQEEIAELTALLKGKLIPYQRSLIERELKAIRSGVSGEKKRTPVSGLHRLLLKTRF
jgi:hypothetical protein